MFYVDADQVWGKRGEGLERRERGKGRPFPGLEQQRDLLVAGLSGRDVQGPWPGRWVDSDSSLKERKHGRQEPCNRNDTKSEVRYDSMHPGSLLGPQTMSTERRLAGRQDVP